MDNITWTCHVCGRERPDDKISVHKRTNILRLGVLVQENIRYCNDSYECASGVEQVELIPKEMTERK